MLFKRVLLVEDEASFRDVLQIGLAPQGFESVAVGTLDEARRLLLAEPFDAVVSDLRLKDGSGIDLLAWMKEGGVQVPVVIMTAYATTETTVQALNLGAVDFLTKTKNDIHELTKVLKGIFTVSAVPSAQEEADIGDLVGVGPTIRKVQALVGKIALANTTVLITGESGTGKEIVARLIHRYSDRAKGPFVPVNCGALPEALLESELFGYEKGAFTGAVGMKRGLFEEAEGGVIFLDEIGEIPLPLQVKLLRVLQERRIRRLGATEERPRRARPVPPGPLLPPEHPAPGTAAAAGTAGGPADPGRALHHPVLQEAEQAPHDPGRGRPGGASGLPVPGQRA